MDSHRLMWRLFEVLMGKPAIRYPYDILRDPLGPERVPWPGLISIVKVESSTSHWRTLGFDHQRRKVPSAPVAVWDRRPMGILRMICPPTSTLGRGFALCLWAGF